MSLSTAGQSISHETMVGLLTSNAPSSPLQVLAFSPKWGEMHFSAQVPHPRTKSETFLLFQIIILVGIWKPELELSGQEKDFTLTGIVEQPPYHLLPRSQGEGHWAGGLEKHTRWRNLACFSWTRQVGNGILLWSCNSQKTQSMRSKLCIIHTYNELGGVSG